MSKIYYITDKQIAFIKGCAKLENERDISIILDKIKKEQAINKRMIKDND
jgi:hypothetical protein